MSKTLQVFHMTYGHLDDLGFLDSAATLLQVFRGYQPAQIGETIVHSISSPLLDDPMRHRILLQCKNEQSLETLGSILSAKAERLAFARTSSIGLYIVAFPKFSNLSVKTFVRYAKNELEVERFAYVAFIPKYLKYMYVHESVEEDRPMEEERSNDLPRWR